MCLYRFPSEPDGRPPWFDWPDSSEQFSAETGQKEPSRELSGSLLRSYDRKTGEGGGRPKARARPGISSMSRMRHRGNKKRPPRVLATTIFTFHARQTHKACKFCHPLLSLLFANKTSECTALFVNRHMRGQAQAAGEARGDLDCAHGIGLRSGASFLSAFEQLLEAEASTCLSRGGARSSMRPSTGVRL